MRARLCSTSLVCLALLGCEAGGGGEDGAGETGSASVDEDAIVTAALDYSSYEQIDAAAMASAHGLADTVHIWVPPDHAPAYRAVDPDDAEASAGFDPGTILVKEHLDAGGESVGLTVMYKGEPGYDPEHGDWWWGNLALDGTINDGGAVDYCIACHEPRADADWVFGVAPEDQS